MFDEGILFSFPSETACMEMRRRRRRADESESWDLSLTSTETDTCVYIGSRDLNLSSHKSIRRRVSEYQTGHELFSIPAAGLSLHGRGSKSQAPAAVMFRL